MKKLLVLRIPILAIVFLTLLTAIWAGLIRIGVDLPQYSKNQAMFHGHLMVTGFLGTLLALERAVAIQRAYSYLPSILAAIGSLMLIFVQDPRVAISLLVLASVIQFLILSNYVRINFDIPNFVMTIGVFCWFVGNYSWYFGFPTPVVILWWFGFLLFTILGERIEIGRLIRKSSRRYRWLLFVIVSYIVLSFFSMVDYERSGRLIGIPVTLVSIWLLTNDIIRKTIRTRDLPKYVAICLTFGYVWLFIGGFILIFTGGQYAGVYYDAFIHSLFIGFIFSVIFGHAPIIFPAIIGRFVLFSPYYYIFFGALQFSLVLRVVSDLFSFLSFRELSGIITALTLVTFLPFVIISSFNNTRQMSI